MKMSAKLWSLAFALVAGLVFFPSGVPECAAGTAAAPMAVDSVHSSVMFKVKHMDIAHFYGAFKNVTGEIDLDDKNPIAGSVMIEVDAESIDTRNEGRDRHLKSQDFFSVKEFPKITFKSKAVAKKGEAWEVVGDLTMHGVTKPLTVMVTPTGTMDDPKMGKKSGYETEFTIKRSDFGMTYGVDKKALGDQVLVMLALEAGPKK
jgi:polyisoprenoid-binding protein YceI